MFLDEYKAFLIRQGKTPGTVTKYSQKLQYFLNNGYSVNDLIGSAVWLLEQYSKGGAKYDPKDHGSTVAAIKHLNEFILDGCTDTLYIRYVYPKSTWTEPVYKTEYLIENRQLVVHYSNGKQTKQRIKDADFYALVKLLKEYQQDLSSESLLLGSAPTMLDYMPGYYVYGFKDSSGYGCESLFKSTSSAISKYDQLIHKILM